MQHLDPDRLVLLALGEDRVDETESAHLTDCPGCRREIDDLRHVADLGAETQPLRDLPPPPDRVWQKIADEVRAIEAATGHAAGAPAAGHPIGEAAPGHSTGASVLPFDPQVRRTGRTRRPRRAWASPLLAAVAAAVVAIAGTVVVMRLVDRTPTQQVAARADLARLPTAPPGVAGDARVLAAGAGRDEQLHVHATGLPSTNGFYQVWLINPNNIEDMVAVGNLGNTPDALLPLPDTIDLSRYQLVDISAEPNDGNAAHSGKSLLRGTLTT